MTQFASDSFGLEWLVKEKGRVSCCLKAAHPAHTHTPQDFTLSLRTHTHPLSNERKGRPTFIRVHGVVVDRFNDPSAGSPTETLLRLLLPLGGRV